MIQTQKENRKILNKAMRCARSNTVFRTPRWVRRKQMARGSWNHEHGCIKMLALNCQIQRKNKNRKKRSHCSCGSFTCGTVLSIGSASPWKFNPSCQTFVRSATVPTWRFIRLEGYGDLPMEGNHGDLYWTTERWLQRNKTDGRRTGRVDALLRTLSYLFHCHGKVIASQFNHQRQKALVDCFQQSPACNHQQGTAGCCNTRKALHKFRNLSHAEFQ